MNKALRIFAGCLTTLALSNCFLDGSDKVDHETTSIIDNQTDTTKVDTTTQPQVEAPDFTLQLLHFADVDGNEETALSAVDNFSALVDAFKKDASLSTQTLVVSSGDFIIPGPRFYAAEQSAVRGVTGSNEPGHADVALLNSFGVDASCIGNHELDAGPGEFADAISSESSGDITFPGATFPFLAANLNFDGESDFTQATDGSITDSIAGQVAKYAIKMVNGEKIGLIGASTPSLSSITSTGALGVTPAGAWTAASLAAELQVSVNALKAMGVNKIILLAHMQQIEIEKALAELLSGVDIIVAGGSNTRMGDATDALYDGDNAFDETYPYQTTDKDGSPTLVVNVDGDYKYLGRLVVGFDENGVIELSSIDAEESGVYASNASTVAQVSGTVIPEVTTLRTAVQGVIAAQYTNILGYSSVFLDGRRSQVRTQETNLGNLTADANLWYTNLLSDSTVHVSIKNGGGIRTEMGSVILPPGENDFNKAIFYPPSENSAAPSGAITEGHLRATLRFDNGLVLLTATAAELKDIMEHSVAGTATGATPGQFPQISGMKITFDPTQPARTEKGTGSRIVDLSIVDSYGLVKDEIVSAGVFQGDSNRTFRMVTLNFLANGGDNYPFTELSNPDRINCYEGPGFGEDVDYEDAILANDPGKNSGFSYTGGEQDALAEFLMATHPTASDAFNGTETPAERDSRIINLYP